MACESGEDSLLVLICSVSLMPFLMESMQDGHMAATTTATFFAFFVTGW